MVVKIPIFYGGTYFDNIEQTINNTIKIIQL